VPGASAGVMPRPATSQAACLRSRAAPPRWAPTLQVGCGYPPVFVAGDLPGAGCDARAIRRDPLASSQGHRQVEPGPSPASQCAS
jgi:hypothetical protein